MEMEINSDEHECFHRTVCILGLYFSFRSTRYKLTVLIFNPSRTTQLYYHRIRVRVRLYRPIYGQNASRELPVVPEFPKSRRIGGEGGRGRTRGEMGEVRAV